MGFMMRNATQRTFFYPLTTVGKFATQVNGDGVARVNKRGKTVTEDYTEGIAGRIVGFRVAPETPDGFPGQYHVILRDPDDEGSEAVLSFGTETSLGRQLINALLAMTPDDIGGIVSFYLRLAEDESRKEFRKNTYLSVYRGRHDVREMRIKPALGAEALPQPEEKYAGDGSRVLDFTQVNAFFRAHAEELQSRWREILTHPTSAGRHRFAGAVSLGATGRDDRDADVIPSPETAGAEEFIHSAPYEEERGVIPF